MSVNKDIAHSSTVFFGQARQVFFIFFRLSVSVNIMYISNKYLVGPDFQIEIQYVIELLIVFISNILSLKLYQLKNEFYD